jgi:mercuric ion transport protein
MINIKSQNTISSIGFLSAFAASICCIVPIIALFAIGGNILGNFLWLEPARPYLIALSIIVLSFSWYLKIKPTKQLETVCNCHPKKKEKFIQSKAFLGVITSFALLMIFFPSYSKIFYPKQKTITNTITPINTKQKIKFMIQGMSCAGCEQTINNELSKLKGVIDYQTSYENKNSIVTFESSKVEVKTIKAAIDKTGYKVKNYVLLIGKNK